MSFFRKKKEKGIIDGSVEWETTQDPDGEAISITGNHLRPIKKTMTIQEAENIVQVYAKHLHHIHGKLGLIFSICIPESFLPFPKDKIEQAFDVSLGYWLDKGRKDIVQYTKIARTGLHEYISDEKAFLEATRYFNTPGWWNIAVAAIKESQKEWAKEWDE